MKILKFQITRHFFFNKIVLLCFVMGKFSDFKFWTDNYFLDDTLLNNNTLAIDSFKGLVVFIEAHDAHKKFWIF